MSKLGTVKIVKYGPSALEDVTRLSTLAQNLAQNLAHSIGNVAAVEDVMQLRKAYTKIIGEWLGEGSVRVIEVPIQGPIERPAVPTVTEIELHLKTSPELVKKYGKRIKAIGGRYYEARGYASKRFVMLPNTDEGRVLADKLLTEFPAPRREGSTVILRARVHNSSKSDTVAPALPGVTVADLLAQRERDLNAAIDRGEEL